MALALPWVIPSSSLRPALPSAPGLVTASLEGESLEGAAEFAAANLPAPRGAGLMTELAAFRNGRIEESLTWLFGGSGKASEQKARGSLYVIHLAIAVLALELARRWQRRVRKGPAAVAAVPSVWNRQPALSGAGRDAHRNLPWLTIRWIDGLNA